MAEETTLYFDFDNPNERRMAFVEFSKLRGPHRFRICPNRPTRSTKQNALYWAAYIHPVGEYLREQGQAISDEQVHFGWRLEFLKVAAINPNTGEILFTAPRSTTTLSKPEFTRYLEFVEAWITEKLPSLAPIPASVILGEGDPAEVEKGEVVSA
jgi:hypothetical protein